MSPENIGIQSGRKKDLKVWFLKKSLDSSDLVFTPDSVCSRSYLDWCCRHNKVKRMYCFINGDDFILYSFCHRGDLSGEVNAVGRIVSMAKLGFSEKIGFLVGWNLLVFVIETSISDWPLPNLLDIYCLPITKR